MSVMGPTLTHCTLINEMGKGCVGKWLIETAFEAHESSCLMV